MRRRPEPAVDAIHRVRNGLVLRRRADRLAPNRLSQRILHIIGDHIQSDETLVNRSPKVEHKQARTCSNISDLLRTNSRRLSSAFAKSIFRPRGTKGQSQTRQSTAPGVLAERRRYKG